MIDEPSVLDTRAPYTVESPLVVRLAGLPAATLTALHSDDLRTAVHALLAAEAQLSSDGTELADELHTVIGSIGGLGSTGVAGAAGTSSDGGTVVAAGAVSSSGTAVDRGLKPALVGLRRALHRGREPRAAEWCPAVESALPGGLRARIVEWLRLLENTRTRAAALPGVVERAADGTLTPLLAAAADPGFRHGLAQSSPVLSAELEKWLRRGSRPPRQLVVRLARYLSRAAAKTSPYSTFTTVGAGVWTSTSSGRPVELAPHPPRHGLLEFYGGMLTELERELAACPVARPRLLVRVNPSLTRLGDRLMVIGPPPGEEIAGVAALPEVDRCLQILGDRWSTLTELRAALTTNPDAGPRVAAFLNRLVDLGLLELRMPVDDQSRDKFGDLAAWLTSLAAAPDGPVPASTMPPTTPSGTVLTPPRTPPRTPQDGATHSEPARRWGEVARRCAELSALLTAPTDLDEVGAHHARLGAVSEAVAGLRTAAGLAPDQVDGRELVHEHAVCTRPLAIASRPALRRALDDLHAVGRWLALHDPCLELRVALGAYCAATFGESATVPFVLFHRTLLGHLERDGHEHGGHDANTSAGHTHGDSAGDGAAGGGRGQPGAALAYVRELLRAQPPPSLADFRLPVLRELGRLRTRSIAAVLDRPADADGVIRVDPAELVAAADALPGHVRPLDSIAWYVQPDGDHLVLNTALSGHGRGRGRWLELVATANGGEPPPELRPTRPGPGSPVTVDSSGTFGHPLNQRVALSNVELDYPFTVSLDADRPRIPLRDLVVAHDPATGLAGLRCARTGRAVTAVHTGMMAEFLLPIGLQLLVRGLGANPTLFQPGGLLPPQPPPDGVHAAPRVEVGLVTVRRASWSMPVSVVPRRERGETDAAYLLRLHRFLGTHGIPGLCFVRVSSPPGADWLRTAFTKARKPLYVDFASPWLLATFERMLAGPDVDGQRVVFREALPRPTEAPGPYVTELVIETGTATGEATGPETGAGW